MARSVAMCVRLTAVHLRCDACYSVVRVACDVGCIHEAIATVAVPWANSHLMPVLFDVEAVMTPAPRNPVS